jgi:hypothetical protein
MNKKEFKAAIRKARYVYAWCNMYSEDGEYIRVVKSNILMIADRCPDDMGDDIDALLRADGDLYIH